MAKEKQVVERMKALLTNPSVFVLLRATGHHTLDTDARDKQNGCVLLQEQPIRPAKPIGY